MWPRLRLDLSYADIAHGLRGLVGGDPAGDGEGLRCLSVRSALDLYLHALDLPRGSEVMMSALTIPHMPEIVAHHGLVPVPIDLDPTTMAPTRESFERGRTDKTRILLVAHLFGGRVDLAALAPAAREAGIAVVEDCAQAYVGRGCPLDEHADVALYSFGTIKTATALGGAIARVRDPETERKLREIQAVYPKQPSREFARKLARTTFLRSLSNPWIYGAFSRLVRASGKNLDDVLHGAVAGFPGDDWIPRLRRAPSASLLRLLARRLAEGEAAVDRRRRVGATLAAKLPDGCELLGRDAIDPTHWVFPVTVEDPDRVVRGLVAQGFDATRRSSLVTVPAPSGHACGEPRSAQDLMARAVFLPCSPWMPERELERLAGTLATLVESPVAGPAERG